MTDAELKWFRSWQEVYAENEVLKKELDALLHTGSLVWIIYRDENRRDLKLGKRLIASGSLEAMQAIARLYE